MPVQKLNRAIMYRAYPTPEQQVLLSKTFGCVRFVWNHMLMDAQQFLNEAGKFFIPTPAKYKKEFPFLKEVDRQQPFFYLDAFHPTTKVVGVPGLYFVRSGISPAYPPLFEVYV